MSNPLASLKKVKKSPLFLPEMSKTPTPTLPNVHSSRQSPISKDPKDSEMASSTSPFTSISSLNSSYAQSLSSKNKYWNNNLQNSTLHG